METVIIILIPILGICGSFLVSSADKKEIKIDPNYGIDKMASEIIPNVLPDRIIRTEKLYLPHNKKMQIKRIIGYIFIILSVVIAIIEGLSKIK